MAISLTALGVNVDRLAQAQVGPTPTTLYTAPSTGRARTVVSGREICNPSTSDVTVRLGLIPSGGTSDGTHFLLANQIVRAGTTLVIDSTAVLRPGDTLEAASDSIAPPTNFVVTASTTGGTLAANTYYYKITATNALGETIAATENKAATTGSTSSEILTWTRVYGATGYKIYRSTATGTQTLLTTISSAATTTWTDTGAASPDGTTLPPTTATAAGCIFNIFGSELPA